jgi:hypothetical protein
MFGLEGLDMSGKHLWNLVWRPDMFGFFWQSGLEIGFH